MKHATCSTDLRRRPRRRGGGCGGGDDDGGGGGGERRPSGETLTVWNNEFQPDRMKATQAILDDFTAEDGHQDQARRRSPRTSSRR